MRDDYLWDGSGHPDPEIEHFEQLLGRYRHKGKAPALPARPRRLISPRLAVAAAILLMALAGLAVFLMNRNDPVPSESVVAGEPETPKKETNATPDNPAPVMPEDEVKPDDERVANNLQPRRAPNKKPRKSIEPDLTNNPAPKDEVAYAGFLDVETTRHIERAQLLLRSFRNARAPEGDEAFDLSYEKQRSRELLENNIALRRGAEMKGNFLVEELLDGLESYLLDIANLPDSPAPQDVLAIKDRVEKRDIVATLQVYSAPTVAVNK